MGLGARHNVPLSISLPPLRDVSTLTAQRISRALHRLRDAICPLLPLDLRTSGSLIDETLDSGYVSADQDDSTGDASPDLDPFERSFAEKWLTAFIGRSGETSIPGIDGLVDVACTILAHLTGGEDDDDDDENGNEGDDRGIMRRFNFELGGQGREKQALCVELHDTPMQTGRDHTDVGLQTWGASIVLSRLMARQPEAFGLGELEPGTTIVELGAGTGLLSLVLSGLLAERQPLIVATDYHPTVLTNLRRNAATHAEGNPRAAPIEVCHLDWSAPSREAPLDTPAKHIVAADVAYAPEHATWLRDCGAHLLAADGVFWLMVSIRPNGKFEGISDVVEAAFEAGRPGSDGRVLRIVSTERIRKLDGIGRADEVAYKLYKVMWHGP